MERAYFAMITPLASWSKILIAVLLAAGCAWMFASPRHKAHHHPRLPPRVRGSVPVFGSLGFHRRFWTWYCEQQAHLKVFHRFNPNIKNPFHATSFNIGHLPVVTIAGPAARKAFLTNPDFDINKSGELFFGSLYAEKARNPQKFLRELKPGVPQASIDTFYILPRLKPMISRDTLQKRLPALVSDVTAFVEGLPSSGSFDPHDDITTLVALLTARVIGFKELTDSVSLRNLFQSQARVVLEPVTPVARLLPWCIFLPSVFRKLLAAARLCTTVKKLVGQRKESEAEEDDFLQTLIDLGDNTVQIVALIVTTIAVAQESTTIVAAGALIYLALHPEWRAKVFEEVREIAAFSTVAAPDASLSDRLKTVPVERFRDSPVLTACIHETIRLMILGPLCRFNTGPDLPIGDYVIPSESYIVYPLADTHRDPSIYPKPTVWDPSRHLSGRADQNKDGPDFIGWGGGKHLCPGMQFAKLEIAVIIAFFATTFDFHAVRPPTSRDKKVTQAALKPADVLPPSMDSLVPYPPARKDRVWIHFSRRHTDS